MDHLHLDIRKNGTRQRALWWFWNDWIKSVGADLGLDVKTWVDAKNKETEGSDAVPTTDSKRFLANADAYAEKYGDNEKGQAKIDTLTMAETDWGGKYDRRRFTLKKTGDIVKIRVLYQTCNNDGKWSEIKRVDLKPGVKNNKFKYQQAISVKTQNGKKEYTFKNKNVSKAGSGSECGGLSGIQNNFIHCTNEGYRIRGVRVYVKRKVEGKAKVTIDMLRGVTKKQKLIHVTHDTTDPEPDKDDKKVMIPPTTDTPPSYDYTLKVVKYAGRTVSGVVKNDKKVKLTFKLQVKKDGDWKTVENNLTTDDGKIKLKKGKKYRIIEKEAEGCSINKILKVKAYKNGSVWNSNDDDYDVSWGTKKDDNDKEYGYVIFTVPDKDKDIDIKIEITNPRTTVENDHSLLVKKVGKQTKEMTEENSGGEQTETDDNGFDDENNQNNEEGDQADGEESNDSGNGEDDGTDDNEVLADDPFTDPNANETYGESQSEQLREDGGGEDGGYIELEGVEFLVYNNTTKKFLQEEKANKCTWTEKEDDYENANIFKTDKIGERQINNLETGTYTIYEIRTDPNSKLEKVYPLRKQENFDDKGYGGKGWVELGSITVAKSNDKDNPATFHYTYDDGVGEVDYVVNTPDGTIPPPDTQTPPSTTEFGIEKKDSRTGLGIAGAEYKVYCDCKVWIVDHYNYYKGYLNGYTTETYTWRSGYYLEVDEATGEETWIPIYSSKTMQVPVVTPYVDEVDPFKGDSSEDYITRVSDVWEGTYYVYEVKAPEGYDLTKQKEYDPNGNGGKRMELLWKYT